MSGLLNQRRLDVRRGIEVIGVANVLVVYCWLNGWIARQWQSIFFPSDSEVRKLLIERLHRLANNHEHAESMVERWLDTQSVAPKVSDLVALANEVQSSQASLPAECDECEPYGGLWRKIIRDGMNGSPGAPVLVGGLWPRWMRHVQPNANSGGRQRDAESFSVAKQEADPDETGWESL